MIGTLAMGGCKRGPTIVASAARAVIKLAIYMDACSCAPPGGPREPSAISERIPAPDHCSSSAAHLIYAVVRFRRLQALRNRTRPCGSIGLKKQSIIEGQCAADQEHETRPDLVPVEISHPPERSPDAITIGLGVLVFVVLGAGLSAFAALILNFDLVKSVICGIGIGLALAAWSLFEHNWRRREQR